ncbi:MAG TPA: hypothetical protein VIM73_03780 [Polyangiaceae bacterium]
MARRWLLGFVSLTLPFACSVDGRVLQPIADDAAGADDGSSGGSSSRSGGGSLGSDTAGAGDDSGLAGESSGGSGDRGGSSSTAGSAGAHTGGSSSAAGSTNAAGSSAGGAINSDACPDLDKDSVPDCEESLVKNPSFDTDVSGWIKEPSADQSWLDEDADKRRKSGSLNVQNINVVDIDGSFMAGSKQCLPVTGGKNYVFYAKAFVASGQSATPQGGFNVQFFGSTDCSGDALTGRTSNLPSELDTWSVIQMSSQAFSNAKSMLVRLVVLKPFNAQPSNVLFDDVLVRAE